MYQFEVSKKDKLFAIGQQTERRYYQAPNFDEAFDKFVQLICEALDGEEEAQIEQVKESLLQIFEEGKTKSKKIQVKAREPGKITIVATSKRKKYSIQMKEC